MQLAPTAPPRAPKTVDTPFLGVGHHVATGHWTAPHGAPSYAADWWTAGARLGTWASPTEAIDGARLLSLAAGAPVAVIRSHGSSDDAPFVMFHAFHLATSELTTGSAGGAHRPNQWLSSDMLRAPQFRGWATTSFGIVGIADRGEVLAAGVRP